MIQFTWECQSLSRENTLSRWLVRSRKYLCYIREYSPLFWYVDENIDWMSKWMNEWMNQSVEKKCNKSPLCEHTKRITCPVRFKLYKCLENQIGKKKKKVKSKNCSKSGEVRTGRGVIGVNARKLNRDCLHLNNAWDGKLNIISTHWFSKGES